MAKRPRTERRKPGAGRAAGAKRGSAAKRPATGYFAASRSLAASYVFITPLFGLYQAGLALDPSIRNGTDPIYRELFHRFGRFGLVFVNCVVLGLLLLAIWRTRADRRRTEGLYGRMFLEACAWTGFMLLVADFLVTAPLAAGGGPLAGLDPKWRTLALRVMAAAGAGVYEEFLFRFLLLGGSIFVFQRVLRGSAYWVVPMAIALTALAFSQAHHTLGGEPWRAPVFWYRAAMGVILGICFWQRGLGITVYAHALYNVALVTMRFTNT